MTQASVSEISELVEYLGAGFVTVLTERICIYIYICGGKHETVNLTSRLP